MVPMFRNGPLVDILPEKPTSILFWCTSLTRSITDLWMGTSTPVNGQHVSGQSIEWINFRAIAHVGDEGSTWLWTKRDREKRMAKSQENGAGSGGSSAGPSSYCSDSKPEIPGARS